MNYLFRSFTYDRLNRECDATIERIAKFNAIIRKMYMREQERLLIESANQVINEQLELRRKKRNKRKADKKKRK